MTANSDTWNPREEIDKYEYGEQSSRFRHLLWYCAGADVKLLERCPQSERVKKEGIGGIVLATGGLAFISGSYAFYTVFSTGYAPSGDEIEIFTALKAIIFGFMWAFVIFNLDRFIVSSVSHGDGTSAVTFGEILQSLPRIFMAVIIGICLSKPLEIRVMKSEIDAEMHQRQEKYQKADNERIEAIYLEKKNLLDTDKTELNSKRARFILDLQKKDSEIAQQQAIMNKEAEGARGNIKGIGPAYRAAEKLRDEIIAQKQVLLDEYNREKSAMDKEEDRLKADQSRIMEIKEQSLRDAKLRAEKLDGLIERISASHEKYPVPSLLLTLLLVIIEVSPIIFKMMLEDGPYDRLVENQKRLSQARYAIEVHSSIDTQTGKVVTHGETYHQADMLNNYEIGNLRVQSDATTKAQDAWLKDQLAEIEKNPHKYIKRDSEGSASS